MKVVVPFAEGFEEIEAITVVDVLRRTDLDVVTVYLEKNPVQGSHNISVLTDMSIQDIKSADFECIALPGGMPGSENLKKNNTVLNLLNQIYSIGGVIAAICAAPIALSQAGLLQGKKVTCYPGFEDMMKGAHLIDEPVVSDGNVITAKGAGCAIPFALKIVEQLQGMEAMINLKERMQVYWM